MNNQSADTIEKYKGLSKYDYQLFAGPDWPEYENFLTHQNVPEFVYKEIDEFLTNHVPFDNPAFCVLPFYGIEYPAKVACCLMPQHVIIEQVRQQMLDGVRPSACNKCWKLEDLGLQSDRQLKNSMLDYYSDTDIEVLYKQAKNNQASIVSYKIDTSTTCNSTCVTCGPELSTAWHKLESKSRSISIKRPALILKSSAKTLINFETAVAINFRGGEPLLSKTNFFILEQLIAHKNTDCFIAFTTNGSIIPNEYQISLLKQFKNLNFNFSIDGINRVFEYLRYPLAWTDILKTIEFCRQMKFDVSVSYTISNLNVMYHKETTQWFKDNSIPYINNIVHAPIHYNPTSLPLAVKNWINELTLDQEISNLLKDHTPQDEINYSRAIIDIKKQDLQKKINIVDYLPEWANITGLA
jgi:sulfatase maturation enzyme AslB (radical SAM superfamily)